MLSFISEPIGMDRPIRFSKKNSNTLSATMLIDHLAPKTRQGKNSDCFCCHGILPDKLDRMGFRGVILELIQSYIFARNHYISMKKVTSKIVLSNC